MADETNPPSGGGKAAAYNILLADDTPMNLSLAVKLFTKRGHKITAVEDGRQALEAYQKGHFDVVLLDMFMPVMDGLEAARQIRAYEKNHNQSQVAIIAMTANDQPSDREKCRDAGMDDFITKPLDIKQVTADIQKIVEEKKARG
jgi:CheY-like chemotaxis protein